MTLKEQILQAIEALPSDRLVEALTFIQSLSTQPSTTSAKSFLAHLKTIGTWSGDDLQECLEAVQNSQGQAQFDYSPNPFE
ncbi:MAG: hypothetical protein U7123_27320 [Potamolinea sp.]